MFTVICFCFTQLRKKKYLWAFEIFKMKIKHNNFTACGAFVAHTHTHTHLQVFRMHAMCHIADILYILGTNLSCCEQLCCVVWLAWRIMEGSPLLFWRGRTWKLTKEQTQHVRFTYSLPLEPHWDIKRRDSQVLFLLLFKLCVQLRTPKY